MAHKLIVFSCFLWSGTYLTRKLAHTMKFMRLQPMQTKGTGFVACLRSLYRFTEEKLWYVNWYNNCSLCWWAGLTHEVIYHFERRAKVSRLWMLTRTCRYVVFYHFVFRSLLSSKSWCFVVTRIGWSKFIQASLRNFSQHFWRLLFHWLGYFSLGLIFIIEGLSL
jgi:hypothetical protein